MGVYVGGIRQRLVHDAMFYKVKNGLAALGWFNANPIGFKIPVSMVAEQAKWDEEVPLNTITCSLDHVTSEEWEVGLDTSKNSYTFYFDIYAESDALGRQLSGDIVDLLRGKFPSLGIGRGGYSQPTLDVFDYSMATPAWIFFCDLEDVISDRAQTFSHRWQRNMYMVRAIALDFYGDQNDAFAFGSEP